MPTFGQVKLEETLTALFGSSSLSLNLLSCQNLTELVQKKTVAKAAQILQLLERFESKTEFGATIWKGIYFKLDRESFADFCKSYEEDDPDDLRQYYDENYPNNERYYCCSARLEERQFTIFLDKPYFPLDFNLDAGKLRVPRQIVDRKQQKDFFQLVDAILEVLITELHQNLSEPEQYHDNLIKNIPENSQYGRFKRNFDWDSGSALFRDLLTEPQRKEFLSVAKDLKEVRPTLMSAEKYLEICKIAYIASKRGKSSDSALLLYKRIADGRSGGLLNIDPKSDKDFYNWIKYDKEFGSHPFEIIRGEHLHTAIHLYVSPSSEDGFVSLLLVGKGEVRADDTVRIALALAKANIAFTLSDADYHLARLTGEDWIAVSPENLFGGDACLSDRFTDGPEHINFAISSFEVEEYPQLAKHIIWEAPNIIKPLKASK
jgi:hypothetical protein